MKVPQAARQQSRVLGGNRGEKMSSYRLGFMMLAVLLASGVAFGKNPSGDLDLLKGEWTAVEGVREGKALSKEELAKIRILFKEEPLFGRRLDLGPLLPAQQADNLKTCSYALDAGKSPKEIGVGVQSGYSGLGFSGIYDLKGNRLKLCLNLEQAFGKRPTQFAAPKGSGLILLTLQKTKK
jgi:uncharacterized protein (TIGR03067 family)